jgi:hypothetical protein
MKHIHISMDDELHARLVEHAKSEDLTITQVLRRAVRETLKPKLPAPTMPNYTPPGYTWVNRWLNEAIVDGQITKA